MYWRRDLKATWPPSHGRWKHMRRPQSQSVNEQNLCYVTSYLITQLTVYTMITVTMARHFLDEAAVKYRPGADPNVFNSRDSARLIVMVSYRRKSFFFRRITHLDRWMSQNGFNWIMPRGLSWSGFGTRQQFTKLTTSQCQMWQIMYLSCFQWSVNHGRTYCFHLQIT